MSDVRVRRLRPEEGLLAGALHVQALRATGRAPAPGHLDRFAQVWSRAWTSLPTWVAEHEGQHAGVLLAQLPAPLPADVAPPQWARVVLLYAVPSGPADRAAAALLGAAARWVLSEEGVAATGGAPGVELADGVTAPPPVLDALGAQVEQHRRVRVTARG